jgi:PAS domain S-box-containing protein
VAKRGRLTDRTALDRAGPARCRWAHLVGAAAVALAVGWLWAASRIGAGVALVAGGVGACLSIVYFGEGMRRARLREAETRAALELAQRRLRTLESLEQSDQRLRHLVDAVPGLISYIDTDRRYQVVNRLYETWFQRKREEVLGKTTDEVLGPEVMVHAGPQIERALRGEEVHFEFEAAYPSGPRWVDAWYIPDFDTRGEVVGFSVFVLDITRRKDAEATLQAQDRRKDEFLATLAHELRNPLGAIRNAAAVLKAKDPGEEDGQWASQMMERQLQHMSRLLEDLLDVSRISYDKLVLRSERIDLAQVVRIAIETCQPQLDRAGHSFTLSLPTEPVYLQADPVRLAQIFSNILSNAAKFTDSGGHIRLSAERRRDEVSVSVSDDGIGIPPALLPQVFGLFAQGERLERSQGGLGIGLSLVRGLVQLHGGRVEARSAGVGLGSEFVLHFPILTGAPPPIARPDDEKPPQGESARNRVLVADDMRDNAESLAMMIRIAGHEVHIAYDGTEAVAKAAELRPEVVILDIGMPRLDGFEACRYIREQPWGKRMKLIALTGWGRENDLSRTGAAGFDYHLVKPVEAKALLDLLAATALRAAADS